MTPDSSVVVVGAGVIGLTIIQALRARGCTKIVVVDINPARLEVAKSLGACTAIRSDRGDPLAEIRAATTPDGADIAFEAVGISPTVSLASSRLPRIHRSSSSDGSMTAAGRRSTPIRVMTKPWPGRTGVGRRPIRSRETP